MPTGIRRRDFLKRAALLAEAGPGVAAVPAGLDSR